MHRHKDKEGEVLERSGKRSKVRLKAELTGYEVKASLLLRIVFHLAGEQVEFSWWPISLPEREGAREGGRETTTMTLMSE